MASDALFSLVVPPPCSGIPPSRRRPSLHQDTGSHLTESATRKPATTCAMKAGINAGFHGTDYTCGQLREAWSAADAVPCLRGGHVAMPVPRPGGVRILVLKTHSQRRSNPALRQRVVAGDQAGALANRIAVSLRLVTELYLRKARGLALAGCRSAAFSEVKPGRRPRSPGDARQGQARGCCRFLQAGSSGTLPERRPARRTGWRLRNGPARSECAAGSSPGGDCRGMVECIMREERAPSITWSWPSLLHPEPPPPRSPPRGTPRRARGFAPMTSQSRDFGAA